MGLIDRMKLQKLTIKAYKNSSRSGKPIGTWEAMFNPTSFSQKYEIEYGKNQALNSTDKEASYAKSEPQELNFKLVLDGTGVHKIGMQKTVSERVKDFLDLTFHMNGSIHEPNFLVAEWGGQQDGGLIFSCRLKSVDVSYTSFKREGSPLRAELDVILLSDEDVKKRMAQENKSSPDLTHSRIVKSGDTLPLLTKEIYGSSAYYLRVAQFNDLDDFRNLPPGKSIRFPPLEGES